MRYDCVRINDPNRHAKNILLRPFNEPLSTHLLYIKMIGFARWSNNYCWSQSDSPYFSVEFVSFGKAIFTQNGREYTVLPGEVYLIHKKSNHSFKPAPGVSLFKRHIIIDGPALDYLLKITNIRSQDVVQIKNARKFKTLVKHAMITLENEHDSSRQLELGSLFAYQIIDLLWESTADKKPPAIKKALHIMNNKIDSNLSLDQLSHEVGISKPHLIKLFTKHLHKAPIQYFIEQKMLWAALLLKNTSLSVKEIAFKTGYNDPGYFSSLFKKHFKISPRRYRNRSGSYKTTQL